MGHTDSVARRLRPATLAQNTRAELAWAGRAAQRAWARPGRERDLVMQSGKAALAAVVAWLTAAWLLSDAFALMAPWVAVVLVQATVYRSVVQGLRQTMAITVGTVLAAALVVPLGHPVAVMAVVLPVTTLLSNWPRFGDQGIYTSTAALFTLVPGEATLDATASRLLAALLGTAIGIGVNLLVRPPVYLRSARRAVEDVVAEAQEIVERVAEGLDEPWEYDRIATWYERASRLPRMIRGVHSAVDWSRESLWYVPRSWRRRRVGEPERELPRYATLRTLEDISHHLVELTRTLLEAAGDDGAAPRPGHGVTDPYAAFLRQVAASLEAYGRTVSGDDPDAARAELERTVRHTRATQERLRDELPRHMSSSPDELTVLGPLLAAARRLTDSLVSGEERGGEGGREGAGGRRAV